MTSHEPTTRHSRIDITPFQTGTLWRHDGEVFVVVEVLLREAAAVPHRRHGALQIDELDRPMCEVTMRLGRCDPRNGATEPYDLSKLDGHQRLWLGHQAWRLVDTRVPAASRATDRDLTVRLLRTPEMDE